MTSSIYIDCVGDLERLLDDEMRQLLPSLEVHYDDPEPSDLAELIAGHAGVLNGHTYMSAELLQGARDLKAIVFLGTGASTYVDMKAAAECEILVLNVEGYGDRTIAEHTIALMFASVRRVAAMDRQMRAGGWYPRAGGFELAGKTLGILGLGRVGRVVAEIGDALGMKVIAWNRSGVPEGLGIAPAGIDEVVAEADVLSLHLAATPETEGIIDRRRLGLMRPDAVLINTARGALVDEKALIEALSTGQIAPAGLDVYDVEPLVPDHPLSSLDNVTLTPHTAWISPEASRRLLRRGIEILRDALAGADG